MSTDDEVSNKALQLARLLFALANRVLFVALGGKLPDCFIEIPIRHDSRLVEECVDEGSRCMREGAQFGVDDWADYESATLRSCIK